MKIINMIVTIEKSNLMVGCYALLPQVWILVCGFPYWAIKEKAIEELAFLVGDFKEVDKNTIPVPCMRGCWYILTHTE